MAYSDYGAYVFRNGERRRDKEDVALFASDEETFGMDSSEIGSGSRIWVNLLHLEKTGKDPSWENHIYHGIMGDGNIRVACYKQGLPDICELTEDGIHRIEYKTKKEGEDYFKFRYEYDDILFEYKGYHFRFESGELYIAEMTEPDGTQWRCEYNYSYGARFEE